MHDRPVPRSRWLGVFGSIGCAMSCQSILGIEDLTETSRSIASSSAGSAGTGNEAAGSGGSASGTASSGGTAGTFGNAGSGGGLSGVGIGGAPLEPSLDAGLADAAPPASGSVSGRVIDFFRRPVPNQAVTIGGETVATDAQGRFTLEGVAGSYTASLMVNMIRAGGQAHYAYVYEGLTRRDPTLQVYSALVERSTSSLLVSFENVVFEAGRFAILAFESPDGRFADTETSGDTEFLGSPVWSGPSAITGNIHALLSWRDVVSEPPVFYEAYQSLPITAVDGQQANVTFDLPADPSLVTGNVGGTVLGGDVAPRSNYVSLRFPDGAALPLIDTVATSEAFSYFVPQLAGTSFVVGAAGGSYAFPPYAVAHRENVTFGQSDVTLSVPRAVTLLAPQAGGAVTASSTYSWAALSQTARTFLWHLEFDATYEGMFVLTSRTQIELPEFADGFSVPPGVAVTWSVETHGDAPDVDALTGPDGYLDAFSLGTAFPVGPNRTSGYYTESERRSFTMGED
jgi:hypothetical protein